MIFRLLALLTLPILAYFIVRAISQRFSLSSRHNKFLFVLISFVLVIGVLVVLGRLPVQFILAPIGVGITFLLRMLPTLMRLLPMWHMFKGRTSFGAGRSKSQSSTIRTEFLAMELDHDTGNMDGMVLKGDFSERRLSALSLDELMQLLKQIAVDSDSSQVLQAYLDRNHPSWREQAGQGEKRGEVADDSVMTRALALEILGLTEQTSKEDIVKAHRHLMQKMHPDRGGSDYLAKKINAAKDYLLKTHSD